MRALVFGATGFLGRALVARLQEARVRTTCVVRPGRVGAVPKQAEHLELDLTAPTELPSVGPHDAAFFLAQSSAYRRVPEGTPDVLGVNVFGLGRGLELSRRAGVEAFLYASSGTAYGFADAALSEEDALAGTGLYALSKRFGEAIAAEYERYFAVARARIFALYGPGQRARMVPTVVERVRSGEPVQLQPRFEGEERTEGLVISPCYVDDAAEALFRLVERRFNGAVNLAGNEAVSIRRVAEAVGRLVDRAPVFERTAPRAGDLVGRTEVLARLLRWQPLPLEEGLRRVLRLEGVAAGPAAAQGVGAKR